jgi:hypothetical protein
MNQSNGQMKTSLANEFLKCNNKVIRDRTSTVRYKKNALLAKGWNFRQGLKDHWLIANRYRRRKFKEKNGNNVNENKRRRQ